MNFKKILMPLLLVFVVMGFSILAACGGETNSGNNTSIQESVEASPQASDNEAIDNEATASEEPAEETPAPAFPVTVVDGTGEEITIEEEPESIVSIQTSNTEIAFALGLGDKVVGVSDYDNYPPEVLDIAKVGGQNINVELVISLAPDIALVTDYHHSSHADVLQQFKDAGIQVIVIPGAESIEQVYEITRMIAKATGTVDKAEEIVSEMKARFAVIQEKAQSVTEKKRVWVEVSPAPDIYTTGKGTFMHEMLDMVNAENAAGDQEGWVKLNEEQIVALQPDVIITTYGYYVENPVEGVLSRDGWSEVPAVKNKQVHDVESDPVTRPGPRLADGVEQLAKAIYPDIFN
jgi:iron complex transport system substrate-binding protein